MTHLFEVFISLHDQAIWNRRSIIGDLITFVYSNTVKSQRATAIVTAIDLSPSIFNNSYLDVGEFTKIFSLCSVLYR